MKKNIIRTPGTATQILAAGPYDARKYAEKAFTYVNTSPEAAIGVANAILAHTKNDRHGWILLFLASMTLWHRRSNIGKSLRKLTSYFGLPKQLKRVAWMSDHVGVPKAWEKLLAVFPNDEVMEELIRTFIVRVEPSPANKIELAKVLADKAAETMIEAERGSLFAHALRLIDQAIAADPQNAGYKKLQTDTLARGASAKWSDIQLKAGGTYLDALAETLQPSLEGQNSGDPRRTKLG